MDLVMAHSYPINMWFPSQGMPAACVKAVLKDSLNEHNPVNPNVILYKVMKKIFFMILFMFLIQETFQNVSAQKIWDSQPKNNRC